MGNQPREQFSSSFGFVMAAAGSAVGLGNIWGFPTQTAENGGAAFVLVYVVLTFAVGFPVLLAEFSIGRYAQSNPVGVYQKIKGGKYFVPMGFLGLVTVGLILSFYSIIAGSMIAYFLEPVFSLLGFKQLADWMVSQNTTANLVFTTLFFISTAWIVAAGIQKGIEKFVSRFMPTLFIIMVLLLGYILTLDGSSEGLNVYLFPDFNKIMDPGLIISALGQAFFSLSLGVGGMLVYGSYTRKDANLVKLASLVTLCDVGVAILAGLIIIPAMYAASFAGTEIFDENGALISQANLIFQVLPSLFNSMGTIGYFVAIIFFFLLFIAAITSSISMMEPPVAYCMDNQRMTRKNAAMVIGTLFWIVSLVIIFEFDALFNFVVVVTTQYSQPLLGLSICLFTGWVINRNSLINEMKLGNPEIEKSFFLKVWHLFVKVVSPILILLIFLQTFLSI